MASISAYTTKAGKRYMIRYRDPDTRKQTTSRGYKRKRDAEEAAARLEVKMQRGEYVSPQLAKTTISELGPEWLKRKLHLKPSSYRPLEVAWRLHVAPEWGDCKVSEVRATAVQAWVTRLAVGDAAANPPVKPKSATVVIRAHGVLAGILDDAVKDRRILSNPARGVDLPRKKKKPHVYLSHADVATLADASRYPLLVRVLAYCGLRWGEAVALRTKDVDQTRRRLKIEQNAVRVDGRIHVGTPKSHERRAVPYPEFLADGLAAACAGRHPDDLVFPDPNGNYLRPPQVGKNRVSWFDAAVNAAKVPRVTPHDLRHTAASFAVSAGANVKAVQRMLGHSSAVMTLDVYAELFDDDLDAVAVAMNAAATRSNVVKN